MLSSKNSKNRIRLTTTNVNYAINQSNSKLKYTAGAKSGKTYSKRFMWEIALPKLSHKWLQLCFQNGVFCNDFKDFYEQLREKKVKVTWVGWVSEIKYGLIAAARGAVADFRFVNGRCHF